MAHLIRAAIARSGHWTEAEIWSDLEHARSLLWLVVDGTRVHAAAVTQVRINRKLGKVCEIVCCAGAGLRSWLPFLTHIEAYAKAEGCGIMRVPGRKGWARMLPDYRQPYIVLEKEIS